MSDLFVWYHGDADMESALRHWLRETERQLGLAAQLYVRHAEKRITFMEVYPNISEAQFQQLQQLAAETPLFRKTERHSEVFRRLF